MVRMMSVLAVLCLLLNGCTTFQPSSQQKAGAGIGAILGGVAGGMIDKDNPWRGAVVGAAAGALVGGTIGTIVEQAAKEAAQKNETVKYTRTTSEGWKEEVIATPQEGQQGDYKLITVKTIRNGKVVSEEVKQVPIQ